MARFKNSDITLGGQLDCILFNFRKKFGGKILKSFY